MDQSIFGQLVPQTGHVTIPWGDYVVLLLNNLAPVVVAALAAGVAWAFRTLPVGLMSAFKDQLTDRKLGRAVDYGFAMIEGAVKGQTLSVDHVDQLEAWAIQYGQQMFPQLLQQLGDRLKPMLIAKISQLAAIDGAVGNRLPATPVKGSFVKVPN